MAESKTKDAKHVSDAEFLDQVVKEAFERSIPYRIYARLRK